MKITGTKLTVYFFTGTLISAGILLVMLVVFDFRAEQTIKNLKDRYIQIEQFRTDIMHYDEILTMSARMAAATGDIKWERKYKEYEPKLTSAIQQAISLSPEIYRRETDRNNIQKIKLLDMEHKAFDLIHHKKSAQAMIILFGDQYEIQKNNYVQAIERLNTLLKKQMDSALSVEHSKEYLARVSFITVLCLLLLSWLIILRVARKSQEALLESNRQLSVLTHELKELNRTLEDKVHERTKSLMTLQNQLLQSEKFSAIGQLAAGVAHEINNPIGFINSNLQTLQQYVDHYKQLLEILNRLEDALKLKDQPKIHEVVHAWEKLQHEANFDFINGDISNLLKESTEGAQKISRIISDLRTFASPDKGMIESVNLEILMESVLNIVWNEIKYKGELKREYGQLPAVVCNPQKIGQVFVNLLINAAQAIEGQGTITVKTFSKDDFAVVEITDTGCGIPPENIPKIFEPFFTTKAPGEGVGLGLSLNYDILRKHAGTISFKSKVGQGTTFTVMLPLVASCMIQRDHKEQL